MFIWLWIQILINEQFISRKFRIRKEWWFLDLVECCQWKIMVYIFTFLVWLSGLQIQVTVYGEWQGLEKTPILCNELFLLFSPPIPLKFYKVFAYMHESCASCIIEWFKNSLQFLHTCIMKHTNSHFLYNIFDSECMYCTHFVKLILPVFNADPWLFI